jgi:hypothetical protein
MVLSEPFVGHSVQSNDAGQVQITLRRLDVYWLSSLHLASDREGFLRWLYSPERARRGTVNRKAGLQKVPGCHAFSVGYSVESIFGPWVETKWTHSALTVF